MVHALFAVLALASWAQGPPAVTPAAEAPAAGSPAAGASGSCVVRVEIISAGTTASFEGACAYLERVPGDPELSPLSRWTRPERLLSIPEDGVIDFPFLVEGLFRLRMVDALGMPILDEAGPVFVSAIRGVVPTYRVRTKHLDWVEGLVVDAGGDRPIAGATVGIDPRFALRSAPRLEVMTDEEGRYRASTARSEVVAIDAADYRTMNARFGPSGSAAPIRMKPMLKRRSVVLQSVPAPAEGVGEGERLAGAIGEGPRLAYGSRLVERTLGSGFAPMTPGEDRTWVFPSVRYDVGLLYRSTPSHSPFSMAGKVSQVREFLIKRGGGAQIVDWPEPEWRNVGLIAGKSAGVSYRWLCSVAVDRQTAYLAQGRLGETTGAYTFCVPVDAGAEEWSGRFRWGLLARSGDDPQDDRFHFEWRGDADEPVEDGVIGALAATSIQGVSGPLSVVLDGPWLGHGVAEPDAAGSVQFPRIGGGTLYISSAALRGDVASAVVDPVATSAPKIEPVRADETASLDLCVLDGEDPVRGLALRVVPVGLVASDEVLDLLGEAALVTDASGSVYLRGYVPGTYEVRVDTSHSLDATAAVRFGPSTLPLTAGTDAKLVLYLPPGPARDK